MRVGVAIEVLMNSNECGVLSSLINVQIPPKVIIEEYAHDKLPVHYYNYYWKQQRKRSVASN